MIIQIFGYADCPWTSHARHKARLHGLKEATIFIDINIQTGFEEFQRMMKNFAHDAVVDSPQMFITTPENGLTYLGGYEEFVDMLDERDK